MDNGPWIVLLVVLTITPILLIGNSTAEGVNQENEPNDSFEDAERIWEGTTIGNVSISNTGNDTDFFVVSIPGHQTVRLSIDRDPGNGLAVFVSVFDRVGNLNSEIFIIGDFSKNFRSDEWVNRADDPKDLIIRLSGEGSYTLKVEFIFILSNFVRSYINPLALLGIVAALAIGIILGVSVAQKRSRSKEERMEKWSEVRVKGRTRFLIQYGLLFGVLMTVFNTLLREIFDTTRSSKMFWIIVLVNLIIWSIGGLVLSYYSWWKSEKIYEKWLEEKEKEDRIRPRWGRPRSGLIRH